MLMAIGLILFVVGLVGREALEMWVDFRYKRYPPAWCGWVWGATCVGVVCGGALMTLSLAQWSMKVFP